MTNPGDFDPAKAIDFDQDKARQDARQQRAADEARKQREQAEKQRVQTQEDLRRANKLKLLRYAEEQLEDIRNPIVSEFVITEMWYSKVGIIFRGYQAQKRETRYYGSWLTLGYTASSRYSSISGLVKLRQPRAGYARVQLSLGDFTVNRWNPRDVGNIVSDYRKFYYPSDNQSSGNFQIFASLEEVAEVEYNYNCGSLEGKTSVESLTKYVKQALNSAATGQPPELEIIAPQEPSDWN